MRVAEGFYRPNRGGNDWGVNCMPVWNFEMEARQVKVGWLKEPTGQTEGVMIGEWNCMPVRNF